MRPTLRRMPPSQTNSIKLNQEGEKKSKSVEFINFNLGLWNNGVVIMTGKARETYTWLSVSNQSGLMAQSQSTFNPQTPKVHTIQQHTFLFNINLCLTVQNNNKRKILRQS
jgi:hypothetical protein